MHRFRRTTWAVVTSALAAAALLAAPLITPTVPAHATDPVERPRATATGASAGLERDPVRHVEPARPPLPGPRARQQPLSEPLPQLSTAEAFALHSRPGSHHTLYLDFDGHTFTDTGWNGDDPGEIPHGQVAAAFDIDGQPATFSAAERAVIHEVWQRVAEDYAPFDLNVTTADPGSAALVRDDLDDPSYGVRALITSATELATELCGAGCVGVAYGGTDEQGIFDVPDTWWLDGTPEYYRTGFTFSSHPGIANDPIQIAETVSHEVGHNLGLDHDGKGAEDYYQGHSYHGPGGARWSPIMGGGNGAITQFSMGEYLGATQTQDDFAVIQDNGLPLRPDDHGATLLDATPLGDGGTAHGVIETRHDVDAFVFDLGCDGALEVEVTPAPAGPNLDIELRVSGDGFGPVVVDPPSGSAGAYLATGLGATYSGELTAGQYLFTVDGVGRNTPDTGYSDYGSVGQYAISASSSCGVAPPGAVTGLTVATAGTTTARLTWAAPTGPGGPAAGYRVWLDGALVADQVTATEYLLTGLTPGTSYAVEVRAHNLAGAGEPASLTFSTATVTAPAAVPGLRATAVEQTTMQLIWGVPQDGGSPVTGYQVVVDGAVLGRFASTSLIVTNLQPGTTYTVGVAAENQVGLGPATSIVVRTAHAPSIAAPKVRPGAPKVKRPKPGKKGKPRTVLARWQPPRVTGSDPITGYRITAIKVNKKGKLTKKRFRTTAGPGARKKQVRVRGGRYRIQVVAVSAAGVGPAGSHRRIVKAR